MRSATSAIGVAAASWCALGASAQTIQILAPLDDSFGSEALGLSHDGLTACGYSADAVSGASRALRWNAGDAPSPLRAHSIADLARAVSNDGSVCAGEADGTAVLWTSSADDVILGEGVAYDLSASGAVCVGRVRAAPSEPLLAFVYANSAMRELPPAPGDSESGAFAVTADGALAVGSTSRTEDDQIVSRACVWSTGPGGLPSLLPPLDDGRIESAHDVSGDGRVVVGTSSCCGFGTTAVRWADGVPQNLTPGDASGYALGVSDDGSIVVGRSAALRAFVWDAQHGARSLLEVVAAAGADVSKLVLVSAERISADGNTIVGSGFYTDTFEAFAWRISLSGCRADFNGDSQADFFDYLDFAIAFDAQDDDADFDGNGQVDFFDYLDFVIAYDAGCDA